MANEAATYYVREYNDNLQLLTQQMIVNLRVAVEEDTHQGEQASPVDQVGVTTVSKRTSQFQAKVNTDIPADRRWVLPNSYHTHSLVDKFDLLRSRVQPNSRYMQAEIAAMSRQYDDDIIAAAGGSSQTGVQGATATALPSGQKVTTAGNATVAKLLAGREILLDNDLAIENEELYHIISPDQEIVYLNSTEINNADLVTADKTVFSKSSGLHGKSWFGITFLISTRLLGVTTGINDAPSASEDRQTFLWAKSGMHLGLWDDIRGTINQRLDLVDDPWEMSVYATLGATRIEEKKVVQINCDEVP